MQPGKKISILALTIALLNLLSPESVLAHGDEMVAPTKTSDSIHLDSTQEKLINLKTEKVIYRSMQQQLGINGQLQLLPNTQADVSLRISGTVTALYANLGDKVEKNQPLIKVESLLIGNPPPSVVIKAPMTGIIDSRNVILGQSVVPNTQLFHISDRKQLLMIAKVFEEDLSKIHIGQEAKVHLLSFPQQTFTGKVILIEPNIDSLSRTINVQILIDNPDSLLKPEMFGRAILSLNINQKALAVTNKAIIESNNKSYVFVKSGDQYLFTPITTGIIEDDYTEVLEGLKVDDEVVTQGNRQLYTLQLTGGQSHDTSDEEHH